MVLLAVGATWFGRRPLAEFSIRRYLAANGVPAQIRAEQVGGNTLVFDDVRLGPHDAPDLVARRITLTLGGTPLKTHVTAIRLDGTLLRIRLRDGGVSFGSLDRLIPAGRSTRFPAVAVTVVDGTTLIDTPAGALLGRIAAGGRLDRDFRATLRTIPASLQAAGCRGLAGPIAVVLTTAATDFAVRAGGGVDAAGCAAAATPRLDWTATLRAPISLARLTARVDARLAPLTAGPVAAGAPSRLRIDAAGPPDRLGGTWHLASAQVGVGRDVAATVAADGRFDWSKGSPVAVAGTLAAGRLATPSLAAALAMPPGLPAVVAALLDRAASATRTLDLRATFAAALGEQIAAHVTSADATGAGGARFRFAGDAAAGTAGQTATVGGRLAWSGGGLPGGHLDVAHLGPASAGWRGSGRLTLAPWRAGDGVIAVRGAGFDLAGGDLVTSGRVLLSSAFAGGRVDGLDLPLAARVGHAGRAVALGHGCATVAVRRATFAAFTIGPVATTLCPLAGGALLRLAGGTVTGSIDVGALRLIGTAGARAFAVDARPGRITVGGTTAAPRFATPGLTAAIDLGGLRASATVSGELAGGARGWSGSGRVADAGTTVAALRISDGAAAWRLAGGALTLDAGARIADTEAVPRFAPLRLAATGLRLDRTGVAGHGSIRLAAGGTPIATVTGDYRFGPATGTAVVDSMLVFSDTFQPFQLSELARGLAANVAGSVAGHADLRLAAGTVGGTARVRIDHVSLATAALGPVTGIDGSIAFDDLPRLHTPPGQTLAVASINPGVVVDDGVVGFQLLDATTIAVERIRWPFAGGSLTLAPVTIRAGQTSRRFVLAVDGLDAEQFLQRFQLKNFNATGRFDGVLPLVFDGGGGRIDGGVLTARAGGGLLQYVGNVGQDSMGGAGRLAFDALRRMRYRALRLRLDGDLDGELVTAVDFVGTNEVPVHAAGPLPIRTTGLPFKFAVTVRAPFRALLGTAQSFSDARTMIRAGAPVQH